MSRRYLLMGDIHLADRAPSSCTEDYLDDLFDLLRHTVTLAGRHDVRAVVWAGDVFHHKTPSRTSHATTMRLIELARAYPCPVYVVPGNHDMLHDRFDSLDQTQPLGVVLASGAVQLLDRFSAVFDGHRDLYGVPWLGTWDDATVSQALADWRQIRSADDPPGLVVTHAPLYPPGMELPYENYPARDFARAMGNTGCVYYGHVHEAHRSYTVDGVTFCNPGALSRGSLHEHNLTREPSVALWEAGTGQFTLLALPHKPAAQVFRLDALGAATTARLRLDEFVAGIGQTRIEITSVESVLHTVRGMDLPPEVTALIAELLAEAAPTVGSGRGR